MAGAASPRRKPSRFVLIRRSALLALGLSLAVAACAPGRDLPPLPEGSRGPYRLGTGDTIRIITFGEEQLTGSFRVNDMGEVALPLLGSCAPAV